MVKRQLTPALAASLAANLTPMTANSTPESFDAVLAELRAHASLIGNSLVDRLQSAHARELAEQQATIEVLRRDVAELGDGVERIIGEETAIRSSLLKAEARADAAEQDARRLDWMELNLHELSWDRDGNRVCITGADGTTAKGDTWRAAIDACMGATTEALAGGERKDG